MGAHRRPRPRGGVRRVGAGGVRLDGVALARAGHRLARAGVPGSREGSCRRRRPVLRGGRRSLWRPRAARGGRRLARGSRGALLYNDSLRRCLQAASAFGRIDARSRLEIVRDGQRAVVPIVHRGFAWSPRDFSMLVDPAIIEPMPGLKTRHARPGLGAVEVVQRVDMNRSTPFLARVHPFAATAVLRPDLGAWFAPRRPALPAITWS